MSSNPFGGIRETDRMLTARFQLGDEGKIECSLMGLAVHSGDTWLILLGLVWAIPVSISRIVMGLHFVSDVIVGSLIGYIMNYGFSYCSFSSKNQKMD